MIVNVLGSTGTGAFVVTVSEIAEAFESRQEGFDLPTHAHSCEETISRLTNRPPF